MAGLLSFRRRIRSGYVISFLLLLLSFFLVFYVQKKLVKEAGWVMHSYTIINNTEELKSALTEAESGVRGYFITHEERFLKPYHAAVRRIPGIYNELKSQTADNNEQRNRLDTLGRLIEWKMDNMSGGLAIIKSGGFELTDELKRKQGVGLQAMDSIRIYIAKMASAEQGLMQTRKSKLTDLFSRTNIMSVISLAIIVVALLFSLVTFNRENKAREIADKRANKYRMDLESNQDELRQKNIELKELKDVEKFTSTGRIARTIAHEVRNPLTNILLATEQLKEMENKNEESPVLLELINRNAARINQLVSDLLNATRFTHLDFSKVNINGLLEEALDMAKDRIDLNQISVERSFIPEDCEIYVDREKIKMALLNIIVNAVEAMEKQTGILQVKSRKEGNKCIIEIKDNGKGMDEEALQKLFEPYFTSKPKGNGLGLTNTQNIILNHRGKISVYSKPGKGTLFVIALDISQKAIADMANDV